MTEPTERRKGQAELHDKMDALIGMLTVHMTKEELEIQEIKGKIDEFFGDLVGKVHIEHHDYVADEIKKDDKTRTFVEKLKYSVSEKLIVFILGAIMSYVGALLWIDFKDRVNDVEVKEKAALVKQIQQPPPTNTTTNHP